MKTLTNYEQQAIDFLRETKSTLEIKFLKNGKHFDDDKENRDIYEVTIKRGTRSMTFNFGASLNDSGFYYKKGVQKINIDRNHLNSSNLKLIVRHLDYSFNPACDTIHKPIEPTAYSILSCLQKYDVGSFENFCSDFGYNTDSRKAEKTYYAVEKEYMQLSSLFTEEEMEKLQEIQ